MIILEIKLTKRLTKKQREVIKTSFTEGKSIEFLSEKFKCTRLTIIRNLKKDLGESEYKEVLNKIKNIKNDKKFYQDKKNALLNEELNSTNSKEDFFDDNFANNNIETNNFSTNPSFFEIAPLDYEIENTPRKDLSSTPISEIDFPPMVYMVVDKKIELEIKYLRDYPDWGFLSNDDLNRKTIEIHVDLNTAKRLCNKDQKVIKVPNTNVFNIVAPILKSRGISRIIGLDKLIAL